MHPYLQPDATIVAIPARREVADRILQIYSKTLVFCKYFEKIVKSQKNLKISIIFWSIVRSFWPLREFLRFSEMQHDVVAFQKNLSPAKILYKNTESFFLNVIEDFHRFSKFQITYFLCFIFQ